MSIIGALSGFSIAAILVGILGAIITGISWIEADEWDDGSKRKMYLTLFVVLFFIGAIIRGGVG